ncbi:Aminoacyl-tRNA editing domain containing protein, putative, partial [Hepatocystis sp. ex Piliocolobus tephrosceles]
MISLFPLFIHILRHKPTKVQLKTLLSLNNRKISCTKISCTKISCTKISCTKISCTKVSCTKINGTKLNGTKLNLFFFKTMSTSNNSCENGISEKDMSKAENLYKELKELKIDFKEVKHVKVNTILDLLSLNLENSKNIIKNLFLKDKKKNYIFLCTPHWKTIDLKELSTILNKPNLRFVDETTLK